MIIVATKQKKKKTTATTKSKMKRKTNKKSSVNYACYAPFQLQPGCGHNMRPCGKPGGCGRPSGGCSGGGPSSPTISGGF